MESLTNTMKLKEWLLQATNEAKSAAANSSWQVISEQFGTKTRHEAEKIRKHIKKSLSEKFTLTIDLADVEYVVEVEPCDMQLEGNLMVSGDDETDRAAEESVREQLRNGNDCAWCDVVVYARVGGHEGFDSLGACSTESRDALDKLIKDHEMHENALDDLKKKLLAAGAKPC